MSILRRFGEGLLIIIAVPTMLFAASDTTEFKVTSYVPKLFRDTRWLISGGLNVNGNSGHEDRSANQDLGYTYDEDRRNRSYNFESSWQSQYVTPLKEWHLVLNTDMRYYGNHDSYDYQPQTAPSMVWGNRSSSTDSYTENLSPGASAILYVHRNLFVAVSGEASLNFEQVPNIDYTDETNSYDSSASGSVSWESTSSRSEGTRSSQDFSYSAEAAFGAGRIYAGKYAALALYMINELHDHHLLRGTPSFRSLIVLTNFIYEYKLRHAVDSRLLHTEAISTIGKYLYEVGLIDEANPGVQSYLQDVWDYFPSDNRAFGYRGKLGIGISGSRQWEIYGDTGWSHSVALHHDAGTPQTVDTSHWDSFHWSRSESDQRVVRPYLFAELEYDRPISLELQFSSVIRAEDYFQAKVQQYDLPVDLTSYYNLSWTNRLDYIVSSRTRLGALTDVGYMARVESPYWADFPYGYQNSAHVSSFRLLTEGSVTYRIAIPTSLKIAVDYQNTQYHNALNAFGKNNYHGYSLSLSINHFIY